VIKRSVQYYANSTFNELSKNFKPKQRYVRNARQNPTIELAVFLDEAAYKKFMPLLDNDKKKLRDMILAYVNQIQAVFRHSNFGVPVDISSV